MSVKGDKEKGLQKGRPREELLKPQSPKKTSKKIPKMRAKSDQKVEPTKDGKRDFLPPALPMGGESAETAAP